MALLVPSEDFIALPVAADDFLTNFSTFGDLEGVTTDFSKPFANSSDFERAFDKAVDSEAVFFKPNTCDGALATSGDFLALLKTVGVWAADSLASFLA